MRRKEENGWKKRKIENNEWPKDARRNEWNEGKKRMKVMNERKEERTKRINERNGWNEKWKI